MRRIKALCVVVVIGFCAREGAAQLASDLVPRERVVPLADDIKDDLQDSRYHLGAVRIRPAFTLHDFGYDNNVFGTSDNPTSDWSGAVAGGARLTLPVGRKAYIRGTALPEYTWYQKLADRRFFGGTYGGSVVGLFNRLSVEGYGSTSKTLAVVSSEIEVPAQRKLEDVGVNTEIDIFERLSVFGTAEGQRYRYQAEPGDTGDITRLTILDRQDEAVRGGFRYKFLSFLDFSVAAEQTHSTFVSDPQANDNKSNAVIFGLHYERPRAYANISIGTRRGQATNGSTFPEYDTPTGSYFLSYSLVAPIDLDAYGQRRVVYALYTLNPYFFETRNGGAVVIRKGNRLMFRLFADTGSNQYSIPVPTNGVNLLRRDDVTTLGGAVATRLYRNLVLTIGVSQSDYQSNAVGYNRTVVRIQSSLSFSGGNH